MKKKIPVPPANEADALQIAPRVLICTTGLEIIKCYLCYLPIPAVSCKNIFCVVYLIFLTLNSRHSSILVKLHIVN